ncbi:MAG TPA: GTPase [Rhodocyclaceae bacterium]|nr:GTPase [Rhodocyclaceae bacterium]
MSLVQQFSAYSDWRSSLADTLTRLGGWLAEQDLADTASRAQLDALHERLLGDRLTVAFVAEFSRGKSELINAIFFADCGARVLPSSAGRTTMCPTEILFDPAKLPCIELLPIETRAANTTIAEYRRYPDQWRRFTFDPGFAATIQSALSRVGERKAVSRQDARRMGFAIDPNGQSGLAPDAEGRVEVPAWRHAVINFPHPLLRQGLVILDTPGLNAIGAEPELTLSLLPAAHAVVFVLAADAGVTRTDLDVWRDHLRAAGEQAHGRIVVLNKIDGLWDGLRAPEEVDSEIDRQIDIVARTLAVPLDRVFAVSAQKGLLAKVSGDAQLLERSRIARLEQVLSSELLPAKRRIVGEDVRRDAEGILREVRELLDARHAGAAEQLAELARVRGRNRDVIEYMARKIALDRKEFEQAVHRYHAVRSVFAGLSNRLLARLGSDAQRAAARRTREEMLAATFSIGLRATMARYFAGLHEALAASESDIDEILRMLKAMYRRFVVEHALKLGEPPRFSTRRYEQRIARLEEAFNRHLNRPVSILTMEKRALTEKFFETVVTQARGTFAIAARDAEGWLRAVAGPLETQLREHQAQLRRRQENLDRVNEAAGALEARLAELRETEARLAVQLAELAEFGAALNGSLQVAAEPAAA